MSLPTLTLLTTDISTPKRQKSDEDEGHKGLISSVIIKDKRHPPPSDSLNLIFRTGTDEDKISFVTWLIDKLLADKKLQDATGFMWNSVKDLHGTTFVYAEEIYSPNKTKTFAFEYDDTNSKLMLFHLIKKGKLDSAFGYTHGGSFLLTFSN